MEELGIPGLGGESGNAEALATTVLEQCGGGKVLFLRGDQAKDTVVEVLTGGGVEVDQVVVYESLANPGLEALLASLPLPTWVVLFSPSGARLSLPLLEARHGGQALAAARLVAIGGATCHLPLATCHLPPVTCHLSPTTYHLPPVTFPLPQAPAPPPVCSTWATWCTGWRPPPPPRACWGSSGRARAGLAPSYLIN